LSAFGIRPLPPHSLQAIHSAAGLHGLPDRWESGAVAARTSLLSWCCERLFHPNLFHSVITGFAKSNQHSLGEMDTFFVTFRDLVSRCAVPRTGMINESGFDGACHHDEGVF